MNDQQAMCFVRSALTVGDDTLLVSRPREKFVFHACVYFFGGVHCQTLTTRVADAGSEIDGGKKGQETG